MRSRRSFFPKRKESESLSLPFAEPEQPPALDTTPDEPDLSSLVEAAERKRLWLGLLLPELVFEVHVEQKDRSTPIAIIEDRQGQLVVRAMSAEARQRGLTENMTLAAALALYPELELREFDARRLKAELVRLAEASETYTAMTCLQPPDGLLLEIGGSLRLFGGLKKLNETITNDFSAAGHVVLNAVAPTPQAAAWLAGWRPGIVVTEIKNLNRALRSLPLTRLGWPADVMRRLDAIGVRTLGECRRLPRSGFARRFGPIRLLALDRAYGSSPDLRLPYRAPEFFTDQLELNGEIDDTNLLLEGCRILLERLTRFLIRRQAAIQTLCIRFYPLHGQATMLDIRFNEAGQNLSHGLDLLKIKMERLELTAPAVFLELRTDAVRTINAHSGHLPFLSGHVSATGNTNFAVFLERLRARLGRSAVRGVDLAEELRPELAMRFTNPDDTEKIRHCAAFSPWHELKRIPQGTMVLQPAGRLILQRPLWILDPPHELAVLKSVPCHRGRLRIFSGPERIETGWWDGRDTARDYYVAANSAGARLWIFRERLYRKGRWYLHGVFG